MWCSWQFLVRSVRVPPVAFIQARSRIDRWELRKYRSRTGMEAEMKMELSLWWCRILDKWWHHCCLSNNRLGVYIGTLAEGSWILYVALAHSRLLTRVSLTLVWVSGSKWLTQVAYECSLFDKQQCSNFRLSMGYMTFVFKRWSEFWSQCSEFLITKKVSIIGNKVFFTQP